MINELYEQLKTACNNEERGKITPSEYNTALPLVLGRVYEELFLDFRSLVNKKNKYSLGSGMSDDSYTQRQLLEYYLVANHNLVLTSRKATLPNDLMYVDTLVNENSVGYDKLPLNKFNLFLSSRTKPTKCYPSYTQYGNTIEIYPTGQAIMSYYRKYKNPKWTYVIVSGKEKFNADAIDFQDVDIHKTQQGRIFNELLAYFGLNRKDPQIQQTGINKEAERYTKSKSQ